VGMAGYSGTTTTTTTTTTILKLRYTIASPVTV